MLLRAASAKPKKVELYTLTINNDVAEMKDSVLMRGTIVRERADLTRMMPIHQACMYGRLTAFQELQEIGKRFGKIYVVELSFNRIIRCVSKELI